MKTDYFRRNEWTCEHAVGFFLLSVSFLFVSRILLEIIWAHGGSTTGGVRNHVSQPIFLCVLLKWLGSSASRLHLDYSGAHHAQERCLFASVGLWRCSLSLYSHPRLFIPSGDVDRTSVGMTRSAARKETTAAPSPVAGSPLTRRSTTSPWSPGNFPACWLCCFSSPWDTPCTGRCASNRGSGPSTHSTDTHLLPRHRSRSLKAVDWMCLLTSSCHPTMNVNACRRMRRRCALGSEQLEPRVGRRFDKVAEPLCGTSVSTFEIVFYSNIMYQTTNCTGLSPRPPAVPLIL